MTIHLLVEGTSERAFFDRWAPRLRLVLDVKIHPHQGKGTLPAKPNSPPTPRLRGLLDQLPAKLRGFSTAAETIDCIFVLVDADNDDPDVLTKEISTVAKRCAPNLNVQVGIAVEETEAFYFGDLRAIKSAFPTANLLLAREYVPDSICGTWERFGQVIGDGGGNKVLWAEAMGPHVTTDPSKSRSPSFRRIVKLLTTIKQSTPAQTRRRPHSRSGT